MPTVTANGIHLYYEMHGTGQPLVVINGLGVAGAKFSPITKPLVDHFQVLTLDNRGAGRSDKPDEPYSIELMAKDAAVVMEAAGISKASVMGISMGGRIALELALQRPELIDKLVLVSTGARTKNSWQRRLRTSYFLKRLSRDQQPKYAFLRQRAASNTYNATDRLGQVKVPTLILNGERDKLIPLTIAKEMHQGIVNSKLVIFKGGHLFFLFREPRRFVDTVVDFVTP